MLVTGGVIAPQHQTDVTNAILTIIGAITMLMPAVTYIMGRTWLKAKTAQPVQPTVNVGSTTVVQ